MENASKALLMAAGVLIGILVLSLAVYLIVTFGTASAQMHKENEENQLNQFNSQFTSYVGKEDITIYDIITVANLATENNTYYEYGKIAKQDNVGNNYYITVTMEMTGGNLYQDIESWDDLKTRYDNLIKSELTPDGKENSDFKNYTCKVYISEITKRVYKVEFRVKN